MHSLGVSLVNIEYGISTVLVDEALLTLSKVHRSCLVSELLDISGVCVRVRLVSH